MPRPAGEQHTTNIMPAVMEAWLKGITGQRRRRHRAVCPHCLSVTGRAARRREGMRDRQEDRQQAHTLTTALYTAERLPGRGGKQAAPAPPWQARNTAECCGGPAARGEVMGL